jgi:hypothetical protein
MPTLLAFTINHRSNYGINSDVFRKGFKIMKFIKIYEVFTKSLAALFTTMATIYLVPTLVYNIWLAPARIITSTSPNGAIKIDFITHGSLGMTSINLITPDGYWNNKTKIYSIGGDEVIFPKDLQVFWSEDSSIFLATSRQDRIITPELIEKEKAKLNSGDNLVLMFDIANNKMSHNLFLPRPIFRLYKNDIKKIKWHNCNICKQQ